MPQNNLATTAPAPVRGVSPELQQEIEQFLYFEAGLLDDHQIAEWMDLMAKDIHYFMPLRSNRGPRERNKEYSGAHDIAYFDESKASLDLRLRKLQTGVAWAEEPPSRTRHLVTNVRISPLANPNEYEVKSAFLLYRNRAEHQTDVFAGERIDGLRRSDSAAGFEIFKRHIHLDQSTLLANNLSIFF